MGKGLALTPSLHESFVLSILFRPILVGKYFELSPDGLWADLVVYQFFPTTITT